MLKGLRKWTLRRFYAPKSEQSYGWTELWPRFAGSCPDQNIPWRWECAMLSLERSFQFLEKKQTETICILTVFGTRENCQLCHVSIGICFPFSVRFFHNSPCHSNYQRYLFLNKTCLPRRPHLLLQWSGDSELEFSNHFSSVYRWGYEHKLILSKNNLNCLGAKQARKIFKVPPPPASLASLAYEY